MKKDLLPYLQIGMLLIIGVAIGVILFDSLRDLKGCEPTKHWQDLIVLERINGVEAGKSVVSYATINNIIYKTNQEGFERGDKVELWVYPCESVYKFIKIDHINLDE